MWTLRTSAVCLAKGFGKLRNRNKVPKIIIIAGPNGAGKTTFAREFLPTEAKTFNFINADLIALGLAPFSPGSVAVRAARLMLEEIDQHASQRRSFAFETTLSGLSYVRRIRLWRQMGYEVKLWFLRLPSPEVAVERVALRVLQGGHNVPEHIVRRRFTLGLKNFHRLYHHEVNSWIVFDSFERPPSLVDWSDE